jgi:hypothetical protein
LLQPPPEKNLRQARSELSRQHPWSTVKGRGENNAQKNRSKGVVKLCNYLFFFFSHVFALGRNPGDEHGQMDGDCSVRVSQPSRARAQASKRHHIALGPEFHRWRNGPEEAQCKRDQILNKVPREAARVAGMLFRHPPASSKPAPFPLGCVPVMHSAVLHGPRAVPCPSWRREGVAGLVSKSAGRLTPCLSLTLF